MNVDEWTKVLRKQTKQIGTYQKAFEHTIDALAKTLAERDEAYQQFVDEGSAVLVDKISDRGAVNKVKNPLLQVWTDLNRDALAYWRDLGLTPAGLKRINDGMMQKKESGSALEDALKSLAT